MTAITIEVVYASLERQTIVQLEVDSSSNVRQAIDASGVLQTHPEIDLEHASVGVWNKVVTLDAGLSDGDRVEIYRPLLADPKVVRRRRAKEATTRKC